MAAPVASTCGASRHQLMAARDLSDIEDAHPRLGEFARDRHAIVDFNAQRVARGQEVFLKHVPINMAALCIASLPEAYLMERSGAVLGRTRRLKYPQAVRRVIELRSSSCTSSRKVGWILRCGRCALRPRPRSDPACSAHACGDPVLVLNPRPAATTPPTNSSITSIRAQCWTHDGEETTGLINQLEMLFTLHCFCWVTLRAMRQAG